MALVLGELGVRAFGLFEMGVRNGLSYGFFFRERVMSQCCQANKSVWGMSWRQEAMKGVADCEKPGGAVKRALIPGSLNNCILNT